MNARVNCIVVVTLMAVAVVAPAQAATRVYDVDPAYRQEVYEALRQMLDLNGSLGGRVQLLPTGQILVDTFEDGRQEEVAAVLAAIENSDPGSTPTVTLRYWVLQGTPGADDVAVPALLADAVRELETVHGDLGIRILDTAIVSGRAGREAFYANERIEIMHTAHASEATVNATIFFASENQELHVDVSMTPGEFVVLSSGTSEQGVMAVIVNWPGFD